MRKKTRKTRVMTPSVEGLDKRIAPSAGVAEAMIGPSNPGSGAGSTKPVTSDS